MRYFLVFFFILILFTSNSFAQNYGYVIQKDSIYFTLDLVDCKKVTTDDGKTLDISTLKINSINLTADWNKWIKDSPSYQLKKQSETKYTFVQPLAEAGEGMRYFKFLINDQFWVEPPSIAKNRSPIWGDVRYQNWLIYLPNSSKTDVTCENGYSFDVYIKNLPDSSFVGVRENKKMLNSTTVSRGKAKWQGNTKEANNVDILFSINNKPIPLILENKKYKITGVYKKNQIKKLKITGSPLTNDFRSYLKGIRKYVNQQSRINNKSQKYADRANTTKNARHIAAFLKAQKEMDEYGYKFMLTHPASYFSLILFSYNWQSYSLDSAKRVFDNFKPLLKQSALGKDMALGLANGSQIKIGDEMKKFSLPDTSGKLVALQDFKGKWIILDFWASWCGPCMKSMPMLKKIRTSYPEKDLAIIGISADKQKDAWMDAIQKEKTDWVQLCDFKAERGLAVSQYNVILYPTYILINPEGKIHYLSKNIDELTSYLESIDMNKK